jgi:drug/metabolite transporter (DMT)-like permease
MSGHTAADNLKAAAIMALTMSLYGSNDAIVKAMAGHLPVGEIMVLRGAFTVVLLVFVTRALGDRITVAGLFERWTLVRASIEIAATFLFLTSIKLLPLATATTLLFAAPIFVTALSIPILGEHVGVWRWSAVVAGFVGVVLIAAPGPKGFDATILLPIVAAFGVSARDIVTRFIPQTVPAGSVAVTSGTLVALSGFATLPWGWAAPATGDIAWLAGAGLLLAGAYAFNVVAIRSGDLSFTAPFKYVVILWATVYGMVFWNEVPSARAVLGAAIIIASGLVIFYRERRRAALPAEAPETT